MAFSLPATLTKPPMFEPCGGIAPYEHLGTIEWTWGAQEDTVRVWMENLAGAPIEDDCDYTYFSPTSRHVCILDEDPGAPYYVYVKIEYTVSGHNRPIEGSPILCIHPGP